MLGAGRLHGVEEQGDDSGKGAETAPRVVQGSHVEAIGRAAHGGESSLLDCCTRHVLRLRGSDVVRRANVRHASGVHPPGNCCRRRQ